MTHSIHKINSLGCAVLFALFAQSAAAMGLGEIQVESHLGERLKAKIELLEFHPSELEEVKLHLASAQMYAKNDLLFPSGQHFEFKLSEYRSAPVLLVTSRTPIEDPFLNLLIEVSSSSAAGTIFKGYTILLDPAAFAPSEAVVVASAQRLPEAVPMPAVSASAVETPTARKVELVPGLAAVEPFPVVVKQPAVALPPKVNPAPRKSTSIKKRTTGNYSKRNNRSDGQLALTFSTALTLTNNGMGASRQPNLSISQSDANNSAAFGDSLKMGDALQEELIAKEKSIKEMKEQISEMEALVTRLRLKLGQPAASAVAADVNSVQSQVAVAGVTPVLAVVASAVTPSEAEQSERVVSPPKVVMKSDNWVGELEHYRDQLLIALGALLLTLLVLFGYKKWRDRAVVQGGLFDDLDKSVTHSSLKESAKPVVVEPHVRSMKMPAYRAEMPENKIDDELDLLESADVYLRFDNFKLAAESVREAIQLNPSNAQSHLKLLGILEAMDDEQSFAQALQALKELGDADAWREALKMGDKFKAPVTPSHVDFDLG